jgi:hypothetical protein
MAVFSYIITGWLVLIAAILLNLAADRLGITGWYGFLSGMAEEGLTIWSRIGWMDILWLFFVYPLSLGFAARLGVALSQLILQK